MTVPGHAKMAAVRINPAAVLQVIDPSVERDYYAPGTKSVLVMSGDITRHYASGCGAWASTHVETPWTPEEVEAIIAMCLNGSLV